MARSVKDETQAVERSEAMAGEPLRILVLGQVKAGKSGLINALFGETRAAVDVVPRTRHIEPFVLEREGMQRGGDEGEQRRMYEIRAAPAAPFDQHMCERPAHGRGSPCGARVAADGGRSACTARTRACRSARACGARVRAWGTPASVRAPCTGRRRRFPRRSGTDPVRR